MGNCISFQPSCDQMLDRIIRWLFSKGYIGNLEKNLRDLERGMEDLKTTEEEVMNKVELEERLDRQRRPTVRDWLTRVEEVHTQVNEMLNTSRVQLQKLCFCGFCSKNVCLSYKYGESVFLLLEEVKKHKSEGNFEVVTEMAPTSRVEERPIWDTDTVGQENMLKEAWKRLTEDGVGIMGLHGMGGVGKTILFKKIHNKLAEVSEKFHFVIWIVVSQGAQLSKLQQDIAEKLHVCDNNWINKSESDKATKIYNVLTGKRFVLMLDDVWETVDLQAIRVPKPTRKNGCRVTFTTRFESVCTEMGDHEPMQVKCLESDKAWNLFKSKVGDKTLEDPLILELAQQVAEKCGGLPLALICIGQTMSSKTTVPEWKDAIHELNNAAAEFPNVENKILQILKYSYDSLVDKKSASNSEVQASKSKVQSCFLYCALFPEDYCINKDKLIKYWIGEGFIGEHQDTRTAIDKGHVVLCTLIRANLLTEISMVYGFAVRMHDVVREMALWIASDFGKRKENYVVKARVGLHNIQETKVKDWGAVRKMSLMENQIEEISCGPKCSELTTLLLQSNKLKKLSGEFIRSMPKLLVLDLSDNTSFRKLPEQISELTSLQYLNLSHTKIEQLPVGFQELKKLTHLNLTAARNSSLSFSISKLPSLRILKLRGSSVDVDVGFVKELQRLEHLQVLTIEVSNKLALEKLLGDQRLANCIDDLVIRDQRKPIDLSMLLSMKNLRCLSAKYTNVSYLHNPTILWITNLVAVILFRCDTIKDLTWLLFAPNLVHLRVIYAEEMHEIINEEKATNLVSGNSPFQKLELLWLEHLPKLESIYWSPLPFPLLKSIEIKDCPNLRKLPLNATSVPRLEELEIEDITEIEWEDEDTKNRFLPLITEHKKLCQV